MSLQWMFETSPAMKRMYRRCILPVLIALPAGFITGYVNANTEADATLVRALVLLPFAGLLLWMMLIYLKFLREADELERNMEHLSMVWGGFAALLGGAMLSQAITMGLLQMAADIAVMLVLGLLVVGYTITRLILMWRYR